MKIDKVILKNFRCFEDLTITFDERLTVLVAQNGAGKTAILDAVRIILWPYVSSFDLANNSSNSIANNIMIDDVTLTITNEEGNITRLLPCSINAFGDCTGISEWMRYREKESDRSKTLDDKHTKEIISQARHLQEKIRQADGAKITLPVFGYYGTGRLWSNKKRKKNLSKTDLTNMMIRTYGYLDCLDPASSYRAFEDWFTKTLLGHSIEVRKIIEREHSLSMSYETKFSDRITVIRNTLNKVLQMTDYENIDLDIDTSKSLVMFNKKTLVPLKIEQLSDGIRNMIGMVADIAYRCYQLNPHLGQKAAQEAQGIVLVDEVDMHLHPQWQQLILGQLQEAFPKLQFIVTTHSPQVLTTVPAKQIRVIKDVTSDEYVGKKFIVEIPETSSYGRESGDALAYIQYTPVRPPIPVVEKIREYEQLVRLGKEGDVVTQALKTYLHEAGVQIPNADLALWRFLAQQGVLIRD